MLLALSHLHKHHLVHLDVKTDNILLSLDEPTVYKLGDFGIVVSLDAKVVTCFIYPMRHIKQLKLNANIGYSEM